MSEVADMVNHPPHYAGSRWESIDIIEALGNQFRLGNALKYVFRHKKKNGIEDLKKARWYLQREAEHARPAYVDRGSFDVRFWRENARFFAESFDLDDVDLMNVVAGINQASFASWDHDDKGWQEGVQFALASLDAHLSQSKG